MQSAYCKHHSTETALFSPEDYMYSSSARCFFGNTLICESHFLIPETILYWFLITSVFHTVLTWFSSYHLHTFCYHSNRRLGFGVSQGSLPGPLLFTLYIAPFQAIISAHNPPRLYYLFTWFSTIRYCRSFWSTSYPEHHSEVYLWSYKMEQQL